MRVEQHRVLAQKLRAAEDAVVAKEKTLQASAANAEAMNAHSNGFTARMNASKKEAATLFVETDAFERWLADQSLPERPTGAALAKLREQFRLSAELGARGLKAL